MLDATVLDAVVERTLAWLDATSADGMARRKILQAALQRVEAEIARYTAAIGAGGELDALVTALRAREDERRRIEGELQGLDVTRLRGNLTQARRELRKRVEEWRELLGRRVPQARQLLKKLLAGPIVFTPDTEHHPRCGWRFTGKASLDKLLAGTVFAMSFLRQR